MKRYDFYWNNLKKTGILFLMQKKRMFIIPLKFFFLNMNGLLGKYAPFKKVSKNRLKFKRKPRITAAIPKTILVKSSLFKKYIKLKEPVKKIETYDEYKHYRNLLSTVIKKIKKNLYNKFFKNSMNNIKNT